MVGQETNKTLRGIAGAVPGANAEAWQHFLGDASWSLKAVNERRLALLQEQTGPRWHEQGVLILDERGDRKKGADSAYVSRQYLGSIGKIDNGVVSVSSHWAEERVQYPLEVLPYPAAQRLAGGKKTPAFASKPQLAQRLIEQARAAHLPFRAVAADSFYGEHPALRQWLRKENSPFVLALKPSHAIRQYVPDGDNPPPFSALEAAQRLHPALWQAFQRPFADGQQATG